jgi:hypothetical protein
VSLSTRQGRKGVFRERPASKVRSVLKQKRWGIMLILGGGETYRILESNIGVMKKGRGCDVNDRWW